MRILLALLLAAGLAFVQNLFFLPFLLPLFMFAYVWRSPDGRWFSLLAFFSGLWADIFAGYGLGRTSFAYLLLMALFWQWWKRENNTRL